MYKMNLFNFSYERFAHFERFRVFLENLGFKFRKLPMGPQRVQYSNMGIKHSHIVSDIKTPNSMSIPKPLSMTRKK